MSTEVRCDFGVPLFEYVTHVLLVKCPHCGEEQSYRWTPDYPEFNGEYCINQDCGAFVVYTGGLDD
jgi:hypothetical protein